jgi:DNA-binding MurR/RpiR family transcriptional regulator
MTDIEIKTRSIYDQLSPAEQKVAWYFLQNLGSVFDDPIAVLAEKSGVSQVMWVRFCKALGFSGLKDMKKNLFFQLSQQRTESAAPSMDFLDTRTYSSVEGIINGVEAGSLEALRSTAQILDAGLIEEVAARMTDADTVRLFGVGASGLVANDLYYKLLRIDMNTVFCTDLHVQLTYITAAKPGDVAIFFSNSGNTTEILELARAARERGACTVAVTKYGPNQLAELADYVLPISSPELQFRSGATSSRLAALFVVDVLFTTLCNKNYQTVAKPLAESYTQCSRHHE